MLILSNFKDYYDTVQSMGIDKSCVYDRTIIEYDLSTDWRNKIIKSDIIKSVPFTLPASQTIDRVEHIFFMVGFCGNVYYGYTWVDPITNEKQISYDLEVLYSKIPKKKRYYWNSWRDFNVTDLRKSEEQKFDDFFIKLKDLHSKPIPVFVLMNEAGKYSSKTKLILNAKLKDYDFVRRKDVYSTYQDIYSYISGVLGVAEKITVNTSEKDKIQSKGFDKWSFRNPDPPKRKQ